MQEVFATARETLLSAGESFFSPLLSNRHKSARDTTGAYFIDSETSSANIAYIFAVGILHDHCNE